MGMIIVKHWQVVFYTMCVYMVNVIDRFSIIVMPYSFAVIDPPPPETEPAGKGVNSLKLPLLCTGTKY